MAGVLDLPRACWLLAYENIVNRRFGALLGRYTALVRVCVPFGADWSGGS